MSRVLLVGTIVLNIGWAASCTVEQPADAFSGVDPQSEDLTSEHFSEETLAASGTQVQDKDKHVGLTAVATNTAAANLAPCPANGIVAFSVTGSSHSSSGVSTTLDYNTAIYTNVGGGWPNAFYSTTFTAPCTGLYSFSVSFVKDAYYYGGTTDDVYVTIKRNNTSIGYAMSGEGGGQRSTGAYNVATMLNQGDSVLTVVDSDGGLSRHLINYNFTGFLVKQ